MTSDASHSDTSSGNDHYSAPSTEKHRRTSKKKKETTDAGRSEASSDDERRSELLVRKHSSTSRRRKVPSVYLLSSSDSPGNILIACRLNGENYLTWSRAMTNALRAKNKLSFIDGTLKKPDEDDPLRERWEICNSMIIALGILKPTA
ncbi:hypothetical protein MLD38_040225 [Melastoma candidum]|uniref:Uncharacterized protein n=1 Tax=Melastoma candidum TaxID=119954 RepID=A0ACB9L6Q9_9MYRT|nr:hypothetical protein MLD38_040225 [Melastoma candidum]